MLYHLTDILLRQTETIIFVLSLSCSNLFSHILQMIFHGNKNYRANKTRS